MPLPKRLARFNRMATNRAARAFAGWVPGFAIIEHQGRVSGTKYSTPVAAFRRGNTIMIALTYGPQSDWVKNVLAAGGCVARTRGANVALADAHLVRDQRRRAVPLPARLVLRAIGAADFLQLRILDGDGSVPTASGARS